MHFKKTLQLESSKKYFIDKLYKTYMISVFLDYLCHEVNYGRQGSGKKNKTDLLAPLQRLLYK